MTDPINQGRLGWAISGAAIFLLVFGVAFLFAGQEMGVEIFGRNDVEPMASLVGAALIGFGAMNWIARRSTLGGIYGRALVAGNQVHFVIGAIVLLKHGLTVGVPGMFWVLCAGYILGAVFFSYLLLGPGVRRQET